MAPIAAGRAPEEEVQALGADVAEGDGLWAPEVGLTSKTTSLHRGDLAALRCAN